MPARAQTAAPAVVTTPAADAPAAPPPPVFSDAWSSSVKLLFQAEAGIVGNTSSPGSQINYGQLFTDKSNRPILNQVLFGVIREVDPKAAPGWDIGFKLQAMYGSDARITHNLGVFDQLIHDRNQLDLLEANVTVRMPVFEGGLDVKAGIYPTPLGFETIDPKGNAFYTKSYIFNYGLPFKHIGALATAHVSSVVDLYLGVDSGTNTGFAYGAGDNNNRPGGVAGIGLNLGKLTVIALSHMGPENSKRNTPFANDAMRYYNDVVVTYKPDDKLSFTTEVNYVRESGFHAEGYGIAQYVGYAFNDKWAVNARAEVFRDNNNFFVSNPVSNRDLVNAERGVFARLVTASRPTTYSEFTLGATYKPTGLLPERFSTVMLRPEIRYDRALNNSRPFNDGTDRGVVTLSADAVLGF
ncbi:MAG: porin [Janthinobacterium lividum]